MRKITLLFLIFAFFGLNYSFASISVKDNTKVEAKVSIEKKNAKIFDVFKTKIKDGTQKIKKVYNEVKEKINNYSSNLKTAIVLMVIGLIFLILGGAGLGGSIVWAVGAIFFIIGALLLLLDIL